MNFHTFLAEIDPAIQLYIEKEFPGSRCVGGKYKQSDHSITLYLRDIEIQCERILGSLDRLKEYVWIILAHEAGHAVDVELPELSRRMEAGGGLDVLYKIETNAWELSKHFIPFIDEGLFELIKNESLSHYLPKLVAN